MAQCNEGENNFPSVLKLAGYSLVLGFTGGIGWQLGKEIVKNNKEVLYGITAIAVLATASYAGVRALIYAADRFTMRWIDILLRMNEERNYDAADGRQWDSSALSDQEAEFSNTYEYEY